MWFTRTGSPPDDLDRLVGDQGDAQVTLGAHRFAVVDAPQPEFGLERAEDGLEVGQGGVGAPQGGLAPVGLVAAQAVHARMGSHRAVQWAPRPVDRHGIDAVGVGDDGDNVVTRHAAAVGLEATDALADAVEHGEMDCEALYEDFYCARGDMENRIKEQQLDMFADRTSTARIHANQRLYFASFAYVLMQTLRRGAGGTELAKAQCGTIRDKLLKVGAQVRVSVRRVWLSFAGDVVARGAAPGGARQLEDDAAVLLRLRAGRARPPEPPGVRRAPPAAASRKPAEHRRETPPNR